MSLAAAVLACTTFVTGEGPNVVVGKSYDWHTPYGLVMVNKRGVQKRALTSRPNDKAAEWRSRFASITFNQYGRELPNGGMNEAGLVVEVMWLDETRHGPPDDRPVVGELQWIQMQLDLYATAAEVAQNAAGVRIDPESAPVHYLACDRTGECVAVEVLGGETVVSRGARTLTNDPYARCSAALAEQDASRRAVPDGPGSLERFVRASTLARAGRARRDSVRAAFAILDSVRQGAHSQWNIVYEPARGRVSWRTRQTPTIKSVELARFDASCAADVVVLDIDDKRGGNATRRFVPYRRERNLELVERSFAKPPADPAEAALVGAYPESTSCTLR